MEMCVCCCVCDCVCVERSEKKGVERDGVLQQVKRLVAIETKEMHEARKRRDANHRALRAPLVISHHPAPKTESFQLS